MATSIAPNATQPPKSAGNRERFNKLADGLTRRLGSLPALVASILLVVVWALTGPIFNFSDTWQLFINTTTTVVTFWMVFVIQNSANRSSKATQLKLDEIIRSLTDARNVFINLDTATEDVLTSGQRRWISSSRKTPTTLGRPPTVRSWQVQRRCPHRLGHMD
jgi:low affinity Fe/Cu permease